MWSSFLIRVLGPQMALALATTAAFVLVGEELAQEWLAVGFAVLAVSLVCLGVSLTGVLADSPGLGRDRTSAEKEQREVAIVLSVVLLLCSGGSAFGGAYLATRTEWWWSALLHLGVALLLLWALLAATSAAERFRVHGYPAVLHRRQEAAVRDARLEVERFWQANRSLLEREVSESLHLARLYAAVADDAETPAAAWDAARHLIQQLQEVLERGRAAQRQQQAERARREARRSQLRVEVSQLEAEVVRVPASRADADVIADNVNGLQQRIRQLQEQLAMLDTQGEEER